MNSFLQKIDTGLIAFVLIFHLFLGLFIANVGFILGFSLQAFYYPLSLLLSLLIFKNNISTLVVILIILISSYIIGLVVFDFSYDGQFYHQETIIQLKNGWNPVYSQSPARIGKFWIDNYPKGGETLSSLIYIITNKIEIGKSVNLIALFASFFICFSSLQIINLKRGYKIFYSFLVAFNPVVISQVLTYYIDALIYSFLVCCVCSIFLYLKERKKIYLYIFLASMVLGASIKFTSLVIFGVFIFISFVIIFIMDKQKTRFFGLLYTGFVGFLFLSIVTINPYLNNFIKGKHIFYPLLGKGSVKIMYLTTPKEFVDKYNRIEKLGITLFGKTGSLDLQDVGFKIPFSIHKSEIIKLADSDIMIGGFGVFYGGFLLLLLLFFLFNVKKFRNISPPQKILFISIIPVLVSVLVISDPWWVRYIPQFYLIPIMLLLILQMNYVRIKFLNLLYGVIFINAMFFLSTIIIANFYKTQKFYYTIDSLQQSKRLLKIDPGEFKSTLTRLDEYGISYKEISVGRSTKPLVRFQPKGAVIIDDDFVKIKKSKVFEFLQNNLYKDNEKQDHYNISLK